LIGGMHQLNGSGFSGNWYVFPKYNSGVHIIFFFITSNKLF
jgi:hypothetical protein